MTTNYLLAQKEAVEDANLVFKVNGVVPVFHNAPSASATFYDGDVFTFEMNPQHSNWSIEVAQIRAGQAWNPSVFNMVITPNGGLDDGYLATITYDDANMQGFNFYFETEPPVFYEVTQDFLNDVAAGNCNLLVDNSPAKVGTVLEGGEVLKLVANSGFKITEAYFIRGQAWDLDYEYFTLAPDSSNATLVFNSDWIDGNKFAVEIVVEVDDSAQGSNNIYVVDSGIMEQVNSERYYKIGIEPAIEIDGGVYILGLINLPFEVDSALITDLTNIKLGDRDLDTQAQGVLVDVYELDMGIISVPEIDYTSVDYSGSDYELFLPNSTPIKLNAIDVVGYDISIIYLVDMYNGEATINVSSSRKDRVISSTRANLGINIPYIGNLPSSSVDNPNISVVGNNGIKIPYIVKKTTEYNLLNGFYTIPIEDEGILSGETGYIEIDKIQLDLKAVGYEKEELVNILQQGVIIK